MAVHPAKQVFERKSINEHLINISKRLDCYNQMISTYPDIKFERQIDKYKETSAISILYKSRIDFLMETARTMKEDLALGKTILLKASKEDKIIRKEVWRINQSKIHIHH